MPGYRCRFTLVQHVADSGTSMPLRAIHGQAAHCSPTYNPLLASIPFVPEIILSKSHNRLKKMQLNVKIQRFDLQLSLHSSFQVNRLNIFNSSTEIRIRSQFFEIQMASILGDHHSMPLWHRFPRLYLFYQHTTFQ